jgi:hypothetical protein
MPGQSSPASTRTRAAYLEHEQAKTELKGLMSEDAKEAIGHGVRAKRSKSGAVSLDLLPGKVGSLHLPAQSETKRRALRRCNNN